MDKPGVNVTADAPIQFSFTERYAAKLIESHAGQKVVKKHF